MTVKLNHIYKNGYTYFIPVQQFDENTYFSFMPIVGMTYFPCTGYIQYNELEFIEVGPASKELMKMLWFLYSIDKGHYEII